MLWRIEDTENGGWVYAATEIRAMVEQDRAYADEALAATTNAEVKHWAALARHYMGLLLEADGDLESLIAENRELKAAAKQ